MNTRLALEDQGSWDFLHAEVHGKLFLQSRENIGKVALGSWGLPSGAKFRPKSCPSQPRPIFTCGEDVQG